jgi:hypothetical protein
MARWSNPISTLLHCYFSLFCVCSQTPFPSSGGKSARSDHGRAMLMLTVPVQAEYLLNCRLMDPTTPDYKRYCVGKLDHFDKVSFAP